MALSSDRSTVSITGSAGRQGPHMERPLLVQFHNAWPKVLRGREGRIGLRRVGDVTGHWKTSRLESKALDGLLVAYLDILQHVTLTAKPASAPDTFLPDNVPGLPSGAVPPMAPATAT